MVEILEGYRNILALRAICNIKVNMRLRNFPFVEQKAVGNAGADKNNIARGAVILCAVINERNLTALEVYQLIIVDDASIPRRKSGLHRRANVRIDLIRVYTIISVKMLNNLTLKKGIRTF